eukprot:CAMPEP_0177723678 /NCGR_PEP_ID=MMETSP0484_2-20121128/18335_1 /TAXON_ID=354590 /ORGANISM="Rhodomonas lens, Strain RHODO" /LENGTH=272 /DNA_ID=CAMNT_0019236119 /DNA_START=420 /DNA_END=1234 /DNA_ORIENTATION=-
MGGMSGGGEMNSHKFCSACEQQFTVVTRDDHPDREPQIKGPKWCFSGNHTTLPLAATDKRRCFPNTVALQVGPRLQEEIEAAPEGREGADDPNGGYDDSLRVVLDQRLPALEELQLVDVSFCKICLTEATTPKLQSVRLQNVPDACELKLSLPELRSFSIHYWNGDSGIINSMLQAATHIESFDSYKLWVDELHFASNALTDIDLHSSDSLDTLSIWAPNLARLGVQACYGLNNIRFLDTHPLAAALPPDHTPPRIQVNAANACLGRAAKRA